MSKCQYKIKFHYPGVKEFPCDEPSITNSKFCFFHDKDHYAKYEHEAAKRFEEKVSESISQNKPLECIGYCLPDINFAKLLTEKSIAQPVYFNEATFYKEAIFSDATFYKGAIFSITTFSKRVLFGDTTFSKGAHFFRAKFLDEAYFLGAKFTDKTGFFFTIFEQPNKVMFEDIDLSNVSFIGSDITRIMLEFDTRWGGKDKITIIEEEWLVKRAAFDAGEIMELIPDDTDVSLESVSSVYRHLRENYEFRLRYDEAGKFFIKEMELKRK